MSSSLPTIQGPAQLSSTTANKNGHQPAMALEDVRKRGSFTDRSTQVGSPRFIELMQAIHRMSRLHKQAISAQIDARQKRRAAGFKRRDVWICDGKFMKELQRLMAEEKLKGFEGAEGLVKLAEECQVVRNDLGPLEQDGTEAEQRLEGEVWKLEQAAESTFNNFESELFTADMYSSGSSSASSSPYQSEEELDREGISEDRRHTHAEELYRPPNSVASTSSFTRALPVPEIPMVLDLDVPQDYMLRGINDMYIFRGDRISDSDSAIGDIDLPCEDWRLGDLIGPVQHLQRDSSASVERYPELITEFKTPRERINKWLLGTTLLSHLEADLLRQQLDSQLTLPPSNWSQLVIAYWAMDEAAVPSQKDASAKDHPNNKNTSPELHVTGSHPQSRIEIENGIRRASIRTSDPTKHMGNTKLDHATYSKFVPRRRESLKGIVPLRPAPAAPGSQRGSNTINKAYQEVPKHAKPP